MNSCTNHFIWIPPLQVLPHKIHPHLLPNSKCCGPANNQNIRLTDNRHFAWEKQLSIFQMEILSWNTANEEKRKENHYHTLQFVLKKIISESIIIKTESTYFRLTNVYILNFINTSQRKYIKKICFFFKLNFIKYITKKIFKKKLCANWCLHLEFHSIHLNEDKKNQKNQLLDDQMPLSRIS